MTLLFNLNSKLQPTNYKDVNVANEIRNNIALNSGKCPGFASGLCYELFYTYVIHGIYEVLIKKWIIDSIRESL